MHTMQKLTFPETVSGESHQHEHRGASTASSKLTSSCSDSEKVPGSQKCATRIAVVEETIAEPKDIEEYKATYENIILVGSGTYGSVYYVRWALPLPTG
jgi:hypothetical protein